jgi:ankyrin repeat protein
MKCARNGQLCTIQFLFNFCLSTNQSIDINRTTINNEHTALSLACQNGHVSVVELLLQHGANPLHKLKDNLSCLIEASRGGHTKIVELLIDWNYNYQLQQQQLLLANNNSNQTVNNDNNNAQLLSNEQLLQLAASHEFQAHCEEVEVKYFVSFCSENVLKV